MEFINQLITGGHHIVEQSKKQGDVRSRPKFVRKILELVCWLFRWWCPSSESLSWFISPITRVMSPTTQRILGLTKKLKKQKKNKTRANKKNKLEDQNQGKNKKKTKKKIKTKKTKPAFSAVLIFFCFFCFFLFFLVSSGDSSCRFVFLVILFLFMFLFFFCFFNFLLKSTFSVLHGVIKLGFMGVISIVYSSYWEL